MSALGMFLVSAQTLSIIGQRRPVNQFDMTKLRQYKTLKQTASDAFLQVVQKI